MKNEEIIKKTFIWFKMYSIFLWIFFIIYILKYFQQKELLLLYPASFAIFSGIIQIVFRFKYFLKFSDQSLKPKKFFRVKWYVFLLPFLPLLFAFFSKKEWESSVGVLYSFKKVKIYSIIFFYLPQLFIVSVGIYLAYLSFTL